MKQRITRLRGCLRSLKLDSILLSNPSNIYYISGFRGGDSYCIVSGPDKYIITDFRYKEQAEKEAAGFDIITGPGRLFEKTARLIKSRRFKKIGFESSHLTVKEHEVISRKSGRRLCPTFKLIESLRAVKDASEIALIKKASAIARNSLKKAVQEIKKGDTEKDIALRLDFLLREKGAEAPAFETIVASGPNASMPHARPTSRRVKASEPVIIDSGARFKGYNSDLTRTHFVGKINGHFKLIYSIVASAQAKAIEKIRPGRKISEIDKTARDYISSKGFGSYFGHATGHSIGIDVHESPSINSQNHDILKKGMIFSVEPAIYIPGKGGVRIEDLVLVTAKGYEVVT